MKTAKRAKGVSEIAEAIGETVEGYYQAGLIDIKTMREFRALAVAGVDALTPDEIKAIREHERVSQPVFARYLNVSRNLVSDWERGVKRPGGPALRLLTVVKRSGLRAIA